MIDEHARQLIADGSVHEQRGDAGIDAAGETADHAALADLGTDPRDLFLDDRRCTPAALTTTDIDEKARQDLLPVRGMHDLGMELDPVDAPRLILEGGNG